MINVNFSDSTKTVIDGYFSSPQNPAIWPNYGQVATSDARWHAYYNSLSAVVQSELPAPT